MTLSAIALWGAFVLFYIGVAAKSLYLRRASRAAIERRLNAQPPHYGPRQ